MAETSKSKTDIFNIYKLAVEMADKISERRITANSFFLTLNSAILLLADKVELSVVVFLGIAAALTWWFLLKSYRELNGAKFTVIQDLERQLPAQLFKDEWNILKKDPVAGWRKRYAELGQIERAMPVLFILFYLFLIVKRTDFSAIRYFICHI